MIVQHPEELNFVLDVEDGWPPVGTEGLPFLTDAGGYRLLTAPLFIKELSVGDVISVFRDQDQRVTSWSHIAKSNRTTIWLRRMAETDTIGTVLTDLRALGCNTVQLPEWGCFAVDVPAEQDIVDIDECLAHLDSSAVAVAFPSFRHPE